MKSDVIGREINCAKKDEYFKKYVQIDVVGHQTTSKISVQKNNKYTTILDFSNSSEQLVIMSVRMGGVGLEGSRCMCGEGAARRLERQWGL